MRSSGSREPVAQQPPAAPLHTVFGEITSETGQHVIESFRLTLRSQEDGRMWVVRCSSAADCAMGSLGTQPIPVVRAAGTVRATFLLQEVPVDVVTVNIRPVRGYAVTFSRSRRPNGDLDLLVKILDSPLRPRYVVRIDPNETGPGTDRFSFHVHEQGQRPRLALSSGRFGESITTFVADGWDWRWAIRRRGTRPVYGTAADFVREGDRLVATVQLREGWSTRFLISDAAGEPLPGVAIFMNDEPKGYTDWRGELDAEDDDPKGSVRFEYRGWKGERVYDAGDSPWYTVELPVRR